MEAGTQVRVTGLTKSVAFNGLHGLVLESTASAPAEDERLKVRLSNGRQLQIKFQNLEVVALTPSASGGDNIEGASSFDATTCLEPLPQPTTTPNASASASASSSASRPPVQLRRSGDSSGMVLDRDFETYWKRKPIQASQARVFPST